MEGRLQILIGACLLAAVGCAAPSGALPELKDLEVQAESTMVAAGLPPVGLQFRVDARTSSPDTICDTVEIPELWGNLVRTFQLSGAAGNPIYACLADMFQARIDCLERAHCGREETRACEMDFTVGAYLCGSEHF